MANNGGSGPLLLESLKSAFIRSRQECSLGDYHGALRSLDLIPSSTESVDFINAERARIFLIQGDQNSALSSISSHVPSDICQELILILGAFINISVKGDLENGLQSAITIWHKYEPCLSSNDIDEMKARVMYYCLEIHDLWRRYGEGYKDPEIKPEGAFEPIISTLTENGLSFEALEIAQFLVDEPEQVLLGVSLLFQQSQDESAISECAFRIIQLEAEVGNVDSAMNMLKATSEEARLSPREKAIHDRLWLRFHGENSERVIRIQSLLDIASNTFDDEHFNEAMKCLEDASELCCELPASEESFKIGTFLHDRLRQLCDRTGDMLSSTQFEFRRCDMICSLTNNLSEARRVREVLLQLPMSQKLPFFKQHHKRQYYEYMILHQDDKALHHAQQYYDFCQKYKGEQELSYAESLRFQALVRPSRMSEDAREALLEDICQQLNSSIAFDREKGFHIARLRKLLLLFDVEEELSELQQSDRAQFIKSASEILDDAEDISQTAVFDREDTFMRYQIGSKRARLLMELNMSSNSSLPIHDVDISNSSTHRHDFVRFDDFKKSYYRESFSFSQFMYNLTLTIQSSSRELLTHFIDNFKKENDRLSSAGHSLEKSEFLVFKGCFYYIMANYEDVAGFDVLQDSEMHTLGDYLQKALETFELALDLDEAHWKEASESNDSISTLSARQSYVTRPLEYLLFNEALTICHELDETTVTWSWIQRSKARGYSSILSDSLKGQETQPRIFSGTATFEDMLWASSASVRKIIFVDWAQYGDTSDKVMLYLLWFERNNAGTDRRSILYDIMMSMSDIRKRKAKLNPAKFDDLSAQKALSTFKPLVAPLLENSNEGDMFIFCPTGCLHNIPLHAIEFDNRPLIERNPILYISSFSILIACLKRLEGHSSQNSYKKRTVVMGAYEKDPMDPETLLEQQKLYQSLEGLAHKIGATEAVIGSKLTLSAFQDLAAMANLLHFHGHGYYDQHDITKQALILGNQETPVTLLNAAELRLERAHVTMISCEGGIQDYSIEGDEPLGLLSAFLIGGATSVIGVLWPIKSATGRKFTSEFYGYLLDPKKGKEMGPVVQLGTALQHACASIRKEKATRTPYHWAGFVLYGAWFCSDISSN